jgi:tetratricopeptide (TPR) repeat protein
MSEPAPSFRTLNFSIATQSSVERRARIETIRAELLLSPENADRLRHELGCLLSWEYEFSGAVSEWEHALILAKAKWGTEHPVTAYRMAQLADGYCILGQWAKAAQFAEFAVSLAKKTISEELPDYAAILVILARIYLTQCRYADAENLLLRALTAQEVYYGPAHWVTGLSFHLLGNVFLERGEYTEAREIYERASAAFQESIEPSHPYRLNLRISLACVLERLDEKPLAQSHLEYLLAHNEEYRGEQHLDTLYIKSRLFLLDSDNTDWPYIETILQLILEKERQIFGERHPRTATTLNNLGYVAAHQKMLDRAENHLRNALTIQKESQESHSESIGILRNLAWVLVKQERYAEAEPLLRKAIDIVESLFGSYHPFLCPALTDLAALYWNINRADAAKSLAKWAVLISEKVYGAGHLETALCLGTLGTACFYRQEWAEAEQLGKRILEIKEAHYGKDHPELAVSLYNLGAVYLQRENYLLAESYFDWSLAITEVAGTENPERYDLLFYLGVSIAGQDRFADAEPLIRLAITLAEEKLGPRHTATLNMWQFLADSLAQKGRIQESKQISRRL